MGRLREESCPDDEVASKGLGGDARRIPLCQNMVALAEPPPDRTAGDASRLSPIIHQQFDRLLQYAYINHTLFTRSARSDHRTVEGRTVFWLQLARITLSRALESTS
jgi:hypothetical protein